jgi:hypothetical protein
MPIGCPMWFRSFVHLLSCRCGLCWLVCVAGVVGGLCPAVAPCGSVHLFTFFRVVVVAVRFVRRFFDEITMRLVTLRRPCGEKLFFAKWNFPWSRHTKIFEKLVDNLLTTLAYGHEGHEHCEQSVNLAGVWPSETGQKGVKRQKWGLRSPKTGRRVPRNECQRLQRTQDAQARPSRAAVRL